MFSVHMTIMCGGSVFFTQQPHTVFSLHDEFEGQLSLFSIGVLVASSLILHQPAPGSGNPTA